jgi:DnaJ-class molecular chaperone
MQTKKAYNNPPASNRKKNPASHRPCPECHGLGWIYVVCKDGHNAVARCGECRGSGVQILRTGAGWGSFLTDYKSLAAGER